MYAIFNFAAHFARKVLYCDFARQIFWNLTLAPPPQSEKWIDAPARSPWCIVHDVIIMLSEIKTKYMYLCIWIPSRQIISVCININLKFATFFHPPQPKDNSQLEHYEYTVDVLHYNSRTTCIW